MTKLCFDTVQELHRKYGQYPLLVFFSQLNSKIIRMYWVPKQMWDNDLAVALLYHWSFNQWNDMFFFRKEDLEQIMQEFSQHGYCEHMIYAEEKPPTPPPTFNLN